MGKVDEQQLHLQQQQIHGNRTGRSGSTVCCQRCSIGLSWIGGEFSFKCIVVLILGTGVLLSAIFWVLPPYLRQSRFDAKEAIKLSATVQGYFRLPKPVSLLVPHIARLEYDIYGEIGVPFTKVAVLSMHPAVSSNLTDVVFGVLSDPIYVRINSVSLSMLRSTLVELFLDQFNLTLTTTIFGQPSSFEILKFPGGITIIPEQSVSIWQISETLFNFTLPNSIYEIKENLSELKEQLKLGLHLRPYENVYVQVSSKNGSTIDSPVTVQASVMSDFGSLLPQRLRQLAQTITGSPPAKNLGLNNSVFGKVKEISLSSYLNRTLHATSPTPSPSPAPSLSPSSSQNDYAEPSISPFPSPSPADSPDFHHLPPCFNCDASSPSDKYPYTPSPENLRHSSFPPIPYSPVPSKTNTPPPHPSSHCGSQNPLSPSPVSLSVPTAPTLLPHARSTYPSPTSSTSDLSPNLSPLPAVSYGSRPVQEDNAKGLMSPPLASPLVPSAPSSFATAPYKKAWLYSFSGFLMILLLC